MRKYPFRRQRLRDTTGLERRELLRAGLLGGAALWLPGGLRAASFPVLRLTEQDIEGPYYTPGAPERSVLREKDMPGVRLEVTGRVLDLQGQPVPGALLDVWQCDSQGVYDNEGYTLRGKLYTDDAGLYSLQTIMPSEYDGGGFIRPAHIHLKLGAPQGPILTTQLYFHGEPHNRTDPYVTPARILTPREGRGGQAARFDFVLQTG